MYSDDLYVRQWGLAVTQENHYYPFGLNIQALERAGDPSHLWQFQGQEKLADFGLGWAGFKWRFADPQLGRFMSLDPIAEDYYYNSTYAFSENKVVAYVELEGLEAEALNNDNEDKEQDSSQSTEGRGGPSYLVPAAGATTSTASGGAISSMPAWTWLFRGVSAIGLVMTPQQLGTGDVFHRYDHSITASYEDTK